MRSAPYTWAMKNDALFNFELDILLKDEGDAAKMGNNPVFIPCITYHMMRPASTHPPHSNSKYRHRCCFICPKGPDMVVKKHGRRLASPPLFSAFYAP